MGIWDAFICRGQSFSYPFSHEGKRKEKKPWDNYSSKSHGTITNYSIAIILPEKIYIFN